MSFLSRPFLAAAFLTTSTVLVGAAPQRLKLRNATMAGLLQADMDLTSGFEALKPAFEAQWFAEDAQRIAQMPPFVKDPGALKMCNPICTYQCGHSECDQSCEPYCLPPQCETICTKSADKCDTVCNKPKCAVICPLQAECGFDKNDCPKSKCRTICAPPACTTACKGSCHSVCTQPQCNWKCKPGTCKKPDCKLKCPECLKKGYVPDKEDDNDLHKVPLMPGMDIKSTDDASLDPAVLTKPAEAPPPPPPVSMPQAHKESSLGHDQVPVPRTTPGPVRQLKMAWEAEDLHSENERLLRR